MLCSIFISHSIAAANIKTEALDEDSKENLDVTKERVYTCPFCQTFKTLDKKKMTKHINAFHVGNKPGIKPYECKHCEKRFTFRKSRKTSKNALVPTL